MSTHALTDLRERTKLTIRGDGVVIDQTTGIILVINDYDPMISVYCYKPIYQSSIILHVASKS